MIIDDESLKRFIAATNISRSSLNTYERSLRQFTRYLSEHGIAEPSREDVISFERSLVAAGRSPSTVHIYLASVRSFFRWAARTSGEEDVMSDYRTSVRPDRAHKKDILEPSEVAALLDSIDRRTIIGLRDASMITLMLAAGLRAIEVSRADVQDIRTISGATALLVQGKGTSEKTQIIRIDQRAVFCVREYLSARAAHPADPMFVSNSRRSQDKRLAPKSVSEIIKSRLRAAGLDSSRWTSHSLRHTAITLALRAGLSPEEVRRFARHSNFNTTLIYSHALDTENNACSSTIFDLISTLSKYLHK